MLIHKETRKIVLNLRDPARVTDAIPHAKTLPHTHTTLVVVPHRDDEVRVLKNLGFDPPAPIDTYYDWPCAYPGGPMQHQRITSQFLSLNPRAYCLNGMGCIEGSARVRVSRKGKSYETDLRTLAQKFHALPDKNSWKVRSLKGDVFGMNKLLDVLIRGEKPTLRFTLDDGREIRCTPDHRMARPDGSWSAAENLRVGDDLVTLLKSARIVSITDGGVTDVYDLCMEAPHHNFVVNGIVVHNSGKTLSALWAFDWLRSTKRARRMLVLAPLSTLTRTWYDEVFTHFPHLSCTVLHGTQERRLKLLAIPHDVYVINHDGVKSTPILDALCAREDIDVVNIDELAIARTPGTTRFEAFNRITHGRPYVWGMTGTPTPNAPTDAWAQCRLITPGSVPKFFGQFRDATMRQLDQFKYVPKPDALETVYKAMAPAVRFSREECIDLPPTTYQTREVPLTPEQTKAFNEMVRTLKTEFDGGQVLAVNEAVKLGKLVQICCGTVVGLDHSEVELPNTHREEVCHEIIDEAEGKVIIFMPYVRPIRRLAERLRKHFTVETVFGETSRTERDKIFKDFQKSEHPRVLVAHPGTMSHGLSLTAANTIVWYAPVTSTETYMQACERIPRPGQKLSTHIINIESTPVERAMYDRLRHRKSMNGALLDLIKEGM